LRVADPLIDDETLADTLEGLTDLHEILAAVVRGALTDEAIAAGLRQRIEVMGQRLDRFRYRATKRREMVREVMIETEVKKVTAPDLTLAIRPGSPVLVVSDESAVPAEFWEPREPRLNRQKLLAELKLGVQIQGVELASPPPVLTVRTK
jgi:hypothetical protein